MLTKIHKAFNSWTFPDKMPPDRPMVSDCNCEYKNVASFIDYILNPSYVKTNTYDFVYINTDHAKGLHAVSEALQFRGTLYEGIMQLLELSLKIAIFSLPGNGIFTPLPLQTPGLGPSLCRRIHG